MENSNGGVRPKDVCQQANVVWRQGVAHSGIGLATGVSILPEVSFCIRMHHITLLFREFYVEFWLSLYRTTTQVVTTVNTLQNTNM